MDLDRLWKNTQEELRVVLAPSVFQTFVAKCQLIALSNNTATIACPNSYLADMNQKRYYVFFKNALDNQTKVSNTLEFIIQEPIKVDTPTVASTPLFSYQPPPVNTLASNLHPKYTFDKLVVGNSNNFAYAAAQGIVKNPGLSYNPFFIWGGVGVGKTHIMQAIGHQILKTNPSFKIRYFPAETFGNELISSLRSKNINQFKDKYRQLDCILVDDIQFIAGKEYIQEEFFHTFNALHMAGKQVVLTSDRKPADIKGLEDRLVSRFNGGLTVDIQPPDFEMRSAIISQKANEKGISLTPDAVQYLAERLASNTREIEGRIQDLSIKSLSGGLKTVTLEFVEQFLEPERVSPDSSSYSFTPSHSQLTPRHIISVCAKHFNLKTSDLCGNSRQKDLVFARHITAYLLLTVINLPLKEAGHYLGGRDHTSIMHARDKISTEVGTSPQLQSLINTIKSNF